jgi:hypothetical protein
MIEEYSYSPLEYSDEIRLLVIEPGQRPEPPKCKIVNVRLSENPQYDAVSYTWGSEDKPDVIYCGDQRPKFVTRNCLQAIFRLRQVDRPRTVWIDAVCIDQTSVKERGHQVGIMPSIYKQATSVNVYLGEAEDNSDLAMDNLNTHIWFQHEDGALEAGGESHTAMHKLLSRPWFSRVWVIQEVFMARRAPAVLCGDKSVDWSCFRRFAKWTPQDTFGKIPQILTTGSERTVGSLPNRDFFKLLCDTRNYGCQDARDRMFALRSLGSEDMRQALTVDYASPVEDLYLNAAIYLIKSIGLDVLCAVEGTGGIGGLPSWVPDWRLPAISTPMMSISSFSAGGHSNSGNVEIVRSLSSMKARLRVKAYHLCRIDLLGDTFTDDQKSWNENIRAVWRKMCVLGAKHSNDLVSTLFMDASRSGSVAHGIWSSLPSHVQNSLDLSSEGISGATEWHEYRVHPSKESEYRAHLPKETQEALRRTDEANRLSTSLDELERWLIESEREKFPFTNLKQRRLACKGRRLFAKPGSPLNSLSREDQIADRIATASPLNYLGLAPAEAQIGDHIVIIRGASYPFVLRQNHGHFNLIGACFVHDAMNGEWMRNTTEDIEIW